MKTFIYTFLLTIHFLVVFAQDGSKSTSHLSFKGVPIDGKLNDFIGKMKEKGLIHLKTDDGVGIMKGEFAGYKDCMIGAFTLCGKNLLYKVDVILSEKYMCSHLSANYDDLKKIFTGNYGGPSRVRRICLCNKTKRQPIKNV
jgi:hypothetical protein